MPTTIKKTENLNMRVSPSDKQVLNRAAELEGTTITTYVLKSALTKAKTTLKKENKIELTQRDLAKFAKIISEAKKPNEALKKAYQAFNSEVEV